MCKILNYEITSDGKQTLKYVGGYLVMRALKKFPMHQHVINCLKSNRIPEKSNLIKIQEKIFESLLHIDEKFSSILYDLYIKLS